MAQITTVLFDLGNTLHHIDHDFIAGVIARHGHAVSPHEVAVAEYRGKAAVDETFRARRAGNDHSRMAPYFETIMGALGVAATKFEPIGAALKAENERQCLWRVVRDGTADVLATLTARGYTLGVVSNADGRAAGDLVASGLAPHFACTIDSHVVGVEKPDARIFELALAACGAQPSEALFVGDIYEIDVVGARNAGVTPLLIDPLGLYGAVDCERIAALNELLERLPAHR